MGRWFACVVTIGLLSSVYSDVTKSTKGAQRTFTPKLPQTKEEVNWRKRRIQESLARLDVAMKADESGHRAIGRRNSSEHDVNETSAKETSFLQVNQGIKAEFAGAVLGAAANMFFSRTTMCVMCSYILEMVDRQVKASPRWANGGGGFFPGQVDFSPGENQGFYRTYPGGYLEVSETAGAPVGTGEVIRPTPDRNNDGRDPTKRATALRMQRTRTRVSDVDSPASQLGASSESSEPQGMEGRKERVGRFTPRDYDRVDSQSEKSMEYQQMFKDLMDAMDEVCFRDLPAEYQQYCNLPFNNGEALVEYYLHDFEDWEICTKIYSCLAGFYDNN